MIKINVLLILPLLLCLWACGSNQLPASTVFDVRDFGAVGDSLQLNTVPIQLAIDSCYRFGGGTVLIEGGNYLTGTILLKDNVSLKIAAGAKLSGSGDPHDYLTIDDFTDASGQSRCNCLFGA